ncbi:uncharacterized protein LOC114854197 [Betta splendens]|uniref:Uncharacterized protein LOC114854197 n=1 Tax=Betta splendens TaxID=158456 RepID=A0A6P7MD59_BETSP|nr:uncharacterized protein LOC114854197 [Betta splendens]
MAFANLFTKLSVISEDVKGPGEAAFTFRNQCGNDGKSNARKRKPKAERSGPYWKKQRYQDHRMETFNTTSYEYSGWKAMHSNWQNTGKEPARIGFTTENNHQHNADHTDKYQKGPNYTTKNKWNVCNSQQRERGKTKKGQKHLNHGKDKRKNTKEDGRHQTRGNLKRGGKHNKGTRMSKDVKVKFVRSMTEEFKEQNALSFGGQLICRHHLWGRCVKGDDCQLAHIQGCNDLLKEACKFYIQGCCTKGESCPYMHKSFPCKFFHSKGKCYQDACCRFSHEPLNEVTKRLLDEVLKRDTEYELASKAEQELSEHPAKADECEITDTNTASDVLTQPVRPNFYNSDQLNAEKEALLHQDDTALNNTEETCPSQLHNSPPRESVQDEPVCYSVEAVLGRQHFKPFPSFITTHLGQDSASPPSSEFTSKSVDQSEVPYSVNAVLRSYKSAENSTMGYTASLPASQTECEEVTEVSPQQDHAALLSQTCSDPTLVSGDQTKQAGEIPDSPKAEQSVSHQVNSGLLHLFLPRAEKSSKSKRDIKEGTLLQDVTCSRGSKGKSLTPKHVTHLRPHVSAQTSVPRASVRPIASSTCLSQSSIGVAVSAEPDTGSDRTADSGNSAPCFVKTAAEPDRTSTRSFLDLFAAPLLPAPVPSQPQAHELASASCSQESNCSVSVSHLTDSRLSAVDSNMSHQRQANIDETSHRPSSPKFTTSPKNKNGKSLNQCEESPVDSTCDPCDSSSPTSYKGSTAAPATNSILKSLFLSLKPYQQDGEPQDGLQLGGPSGSKKNEEESSTVCVFKTQPKNTRKKQKNHQSCSEKLDAHSVKPQPFLQTPRTSLEAAGGSSLCSPATFKPVVGSSGTSSSPSGVATPAVQHHTPSAPRRGRCVDGHEAVTPLKDLFKTLDTTVFHFGQ